MMDCDIWRLSFDSYSKKRKDCTKSVFMSFLRNSIPRQLRQAGWQPRQPREAAQAGRQGVAGWGPGAGAAQCQTSFLALGTQECILAKRHQ